MSMGVTTVEKVGRGHKGIGCLWNRECHSRFPQRTSVLLKKRRATGVCRQHAAPHGPKTKGDGRVPPERGTKWLRNAGRGVWRSRRLSTRKPRTEGTAVVVTDATGR